MKQSRRAKRRQRHHRRNARRASINLVSLMDIFTILVFFLLVNSGDVQVLPSAKGVALPDSVAERPPRETVVVMVDGQTIRVQGRPVVALAQIRQDGSATIGPLKAALVAQWPSPGAAGGRVRRSVTIMADRALPYRLLKRVMSTCGEAEFSDIYLAVNRQVVAKEAAL